METVRSADGTRLAYEREGAGPPLVIVTGAFCDRSTSAPLAARLAPHFDVVRYDRRGRGDSGDAATYAPERELDDLAAVIGVLGGSAAVYGHSSGAAIALEAAAAGVPITRLVAYEPPYRVDGQGSLEVRDRVAAFVAADDRAGAARCFLAGAVGLPAEAVATAEQWPDWKGMVGIAHTLPYDLTLVGDGSVPDRLAAVPVPTLVLHGTETFDWLIAGMSGLVDRIPGAVGRALAGQDHGVDPAVLVPELVAFLAA